MTRSVGIPNDNLARRGFIPKDKSRGLHATYGQLLSLNEKAFHSVFSVLHKR